MISEETRNSTSKSSGRNVPSFRDVKIRSSSRKLGEGSGGRVYRVEVEGQTYAVKRLEKNRHYHEKKIIEELGNHRHIVPFVRSFRKHGKHHLVFELCKKIPKPPLKVNIVKQITRHILRALFHIHITHGYRYGDLKRDNVMIYNNRYVLIDFGYCGNAKNATGIGTLDYMAPELLKRTGPKTHMMNDIWSLGSLVFELLTGHHPFYDLSEKTTERNIRRATVSNPALWKDIDSKSREFIKHLWVIDPDKRPSVKDVMNHPWLMK